MAYVSAGMGTESTGGSVACVGAGESDGDGSVDGLGSGLSIDAGVIDAGGGGADCPVTGLQPASRRHAPKASQKLRGKAAPRDGQVPM